VHYVCAVQESDARSQNYKFTGKERDSESNLDEFGARYYASTMGRFMTPDWAARPTAVPYAVFGDPQSLNLYTFVRNDPVSRADADGHCDWEQETPCDPQGPALTQQKDQQKQAEQTTTQNKSWWQKFTGIFYAKASVSAGLEVGAEVHLGKARSPLKIGGKAGADVKSTMTVTTEGTTVSATKEAQVGLNVGKFIVGPQTSTEDVTVKNGEPLANHEVEKSSSLGLGTEKAEATLSKGDVGVGAEVDAVFISVGIELGVNFDKVRNLF
jgi:RHS repeat-associated protein